MPPTFSPGELAQNLGITQDKVLNWICSGKLEAIDVSQDQQGRPRYRIDADATTYQQDSFLIDYITLGTILRSGDFYFY